jgi:hypothetical protein
MVLPLRILLKSGWKRRTKMNFYDPSGSMMTQVVQKLETHFHHISFILL